MNAHENPYKSDMSAEPGMTGNRMPSASESIRVVVVEDEEQVRNFLRSTIAQDNRFEVIAAYSAGYPALEGIRSLRPHLLVLDLGLPDVSGWEIIPSILENSPETRIIVFTVFQDDHAVFESILAGASGYLLKDTPPELLCAELMATHLGGAPMSPGIARRILKRYQFERPVEAAIPADQSILTARQLEVLNLIALGLRYGDIADELDISEYTVRGYIEKIYRRLNVHSRSEAIIKGRRLGLVRGDDI